MELGEILLRGLDAEAKSGSNALLMYNLVNIIKKLFSIKLKCCFHMLLGMHALKAFGKYFSVIKKLAHVGKSMLHTNNFIKHGQMHCQEY